MLLLLALSSRAATLEVNPTNDIPTLVGGLAPGDVVVFEEGVYSFPETLRVVAPGTGEEPISLVPAEGAEVTFEAAGGRYVLDLVDPRFVEISGITFTGGDGYKNADPPQGGVVVSGTLGQNVTIEDCTFYRLGGTAMRTEVNIQNLVFTGNRLSEIDGYGVRLGCADGSCASVDALVANNVIGELPGIWPRAAVRLHDGSANNVVRDNVIHDIGAKGVHAGATGFQPPNRIEGNAIFDVGGVGIHVQGPSRVVNNVLFRIGRNGIRSSALSVDHVLENIVLSHNSIAKTTEAGIYVRDWREARDMVLANNAVRNPGGNALVYRPSKRIISTSNFISSNVFTGTVDLDPDIYVGWFSLGADFEGPAVGDLYPQADSALIDGADDDVFANVPGVDFNGLPRGEAPDVGAYEFYGEGNPGWVIVPDFKEFTTLDEEDPVVEDEEGCSCGRPGAGWFWILVLPAIVRRWSH